MDDVDHSNDTQRLEIHTEPHVVYEDDDNNSESSDEEGRSQKEEPMSDDGILIFPSVSNYDILSTAASARYRGGVYSPAINSTLDKNPKYMENMLKVKDPSMESNSVSNNPDSTRDKYRFQPEMKYVEFAHLQNYGNEISNFTKYYEQSLSSKLAKLRVLDNSKNVDFKTNEKSSTLEATYVTSHLQDSADRDTNNDSGYSTKVYSSSKGNSPNLSGQIDNECLGASSLV